MCTAASPLVSRHIHDKTFDDMASSAIPFVILCVSTTASSSSADAFGPDQRLLEEEADHHDYSDLAPDPDPTTADAYTPPAIPEEKEKKEGCGEAPMTWRMAVLRWLYWFSKFGTGGAI